MLHQIEMASTLFFSFFSFFLFGRLCRRLSRVDDHSVVHCIEQPRSPFRPIQPASTLLARALFIVELQQQQQQWDQYFSFPLPLSLFLPGLIAFPLWRGPPAPPPPPLQSPPPPSFCRRLTAGRLAGDGLIGRRGLVLPKKFGLAVPDRTKPARSTLQLWELKESGAAECGASAREQKEEEKEDGCSGLHGRDPSTVHSSVVCGRSLARPRAFPEIIDLGVGGGRPTNERTNEADYGATLTRQRTTSSSSSHQASLSLALARRYILLHSTTYTILYLRYIYTIPIVRS